MEDSPGSVLPPSLEEPSLPSAEEVLEKARLHQVEAGRMGGRSRSEAKRAAVRSNLAKARINRWKGREASKRASEEAIAELVKVDTDEEETPNP